jgi:glycolate oxidase iron-sulfur subunit
LKPIHLTVTYQDPCHLAHGQKIRRQPRELLQAIPGLKLVEMEGSDRCCGSAGIYNLTHAGMSQELLKEKMQAVSSANADAIVAPNPGCVATVRRAALRAKSAGLSFDGSARPRLR